MMGALRKVGATASWAGLLAAIVYFLKTGRRYPPPETVAVEEAYEKGRQEDVNQNG